MCEENFIDYRCFMGLRHYYSMKFVHISKGWPLCYAWVFCFHSKLDAWRFYKYRGHVGD